MAKTEKIPVALIGWLHLFLEMAPLAADLESIADETEQLYPAPLNVK